MLHRPLYRAISREVRRVNPRIFQGSNGAATSFWEGIFDGAPGVASDIPTLEENSANTTVYQDAAGLVPVTAYGDPVGRLIDESGNGAIISQSTGVSRPIYGRWPASALISGGVRNKVLHSGNATQWSTGGGNPSVVEVSIQSPLLGAVACEVREGSVSGVQFIATNTIDIDGESTVCFLAKSNGSGRYLGIAGFGLGAASEMPVFDIDAGSVSLPPTNSILVGATISHLTNGWYYCKAVIDINMSGSAVVAICATASDHSPSNYNRAGDGASGFLVCAASVEDGAQFNPIQIVGSSVTYDVTETGQPDVHFIDFNGNSHHMLTSSIDMTSTPKATLLVALMKRSDAGAAIPLEFSPDTNTANGSIYIAAPLWANGNYSVIARGTATGGEAIAFDYDAPVTSLLLAEADISAPSLALSVDGQIKAADSSSMGEGNFGDHTLYIGARAGSELFFDGKIVSFALIGSALTEQQKITINQHINDRVGGVLL